ncbi:MAG TPA: 4-alpha-glucanotransferase [Acidobacteriaceae bacterium]|nr:4-alpha-glucanotransferase [Acidobacteriaceae bacterium]
MLTERASGVLLHVSSLPSRGGIGDLGPAAYSFADFLAAGKQQYWQVLPLSPTGYGNSPYSALSAFAGNPLFISLDVLAAQGWLDGSTLETLPGTEGPADFEAAVRHKLPLLQQAAERFAAHGDDRLRSRFEQFCKESSFWLDPYASFAVLRSMFAGASWSEWPPEYVQREPGAMAAFRAQHAHARLMQKIMQFFFDEQWHALRDYCAERKIRFIGDAAIFVNYDSCDVWMNPEIFDLDEKKKSLQVSGVPPDYFSPTGQKWGNPLYRWDVLTQRNFDWWEARIRRALALCDLLRLDHFRGFEAYWSIPAEDDTAVRGSWVKAPGMQLLQHLRAQLGNLPLIAEDLGLITPEVEKLRTSCGLPGMRVMQFGFSDRGAHIHLPHRCEENMVIYTGTHDNDTTMGWWHAASDTERAAIAAYLHPGDDGIVWAMMRGAAASVARLCLFPMQDLLQLGGEGRMNTPAQSVGNWAWRYPSDALQPWIAEKLAALTEVTDRDGWVEPHSEDL